MTRRPDFFVIGAPKSGTTSLYTYLSGHPDVFMAPIKEPMYFSVDVNPPNAAYRFRQDEERYLALFTGATDEKRVGEASPRYLRSESAPSLINEFQPEALIVVIFRNPVDVAQALHDQRFTTGHEEIEDFASAMAVDRKRPSPFYYGAVRFASDLERWLEIFGKARIHSMIFDDFVADTAGEFARLLEFLDVDPSYQPNSFAAQNTRFRRGPLFRIVRESRLAHVFARRILPRLLPDRTRRSVVRRIRHSPLLRRPADKKALPEAVRRGLADEFRPEVERLSRLLDRDLIALWFGSAQ